MLNGNLPCEHEALGVAAVDLRIRDDIQSLGCVVETNHLGDGLRNTVAVDVHRLPIVVGMDGIDILVVVPDIDVLLLLLRANCAARVVVPCDIRC